MPNLLKDLAEILAYAVILALAISAVVQALS
jgi:hypothetical protein